MSRVRQMIDHLFEEGATAPEDPREKMRRAWANRERTIKPEGADATTLASVPGLSDEERRKRALAYRSHRALGEPMAPQPGSVSTRSDVGRTFLP